MSSRHSLTVCTYHLCTQKKRKSQRHIISPCLLISAMRKKTTLSAILRTKTFCKTTPRTLICTYVQYIVSYITIQRASTTLERIQENPSPCLKDPIKLLDLHSRRRLKKRIQGLESLLTSSSICEALKNCRASLIAPSKSNPLSSKLGGCIWGRC